MKLGEQLYKTQQEGAASGAANETPADPGVVDAEFSEVKEEKKNGTA